MHEAQISKLHDEMARLRELLVECRGKERETQSIVNDLRMSLSDLQYLVGTNKPPRRTTCCGFDCHETIFLGDPVTVCGRPSLSLPIPYDLE